MISTILRNAILVVVWIAIGGQLWYAYTQGRLSERRGTIDRADTPIIFWLCTIGLSTVFLGMSAFLVYITRNAIARFSN